MIQELFNRSKDWRMVEGGTVALDDAAALEVVGRGLLPGDAVGGQAAQQLAHDGARVAPRDAPQPPPPLRDHARVRHHRARHAPGLRHHPCACGAVSGPRQDTGCAWHWELLPPPRPRALKSSLVQRAVPLGFWILGHLHPQTSKDSVVRLLSLFQDLCPVT